ncbi:GSU3473 family protein [Geobacter sp. DSM 9736]|uniref:GSU3473 family protein n=1 Tax=Geobacter sp. DSM 9736 TaxID=1277350 RepID=UPI000B4FE116|nr:hypothetical protein [Geobacter sp. DSM 9736]SNB46061.1 hypothetical protein SAMN06269301_1501 [Geobacter sp. DSM 9736]
MLIRVIYDNKRIGLVDERALSNHILNGELLAFRRLDGWAKIGQDAVRGFGGTYEGPDRRSTRRR